MAAAGAMRTRKLGGAQPAESTHESALELAKSASADDAGARKEQIDQGGAAATQGAPGARQVSARHIASRSARTPNQRENASAPCSTSMPNPSAAR